jgi:transcriptional regulator with XRE-family HTH domain
MPGRSPFAGCSDLVALGVALRELRERRGVQQEAVAYDAGLGKGYVSAAESGQLNTSFLTLLAILRTLRVPLAELVEIYDRNIAEIDPQAGVNVPACPSPEALAHIAKTTAQNVAYDRAARARRARSRMRSWT